MRPTTANRRLLLGTAVLLLAFVLLLVRAVQVQVLAGDEYRARAKAQHLRELQVAAHRGVIYDRNGAELAVSKRMATVYAAPNVIEDADAAADQLAPLLGLDRDSLEEKLDGRSGFVYLARKVDPAVAEQVLELGLRGVGVYPEEKRVYPRGALAPQVLGFVGTDNVGLAGLEKQYDELLSGEAGERGVIRDAFGEELNVIFDRRSRQGDSLVISLDEDIQYRTEQVLSETVEQFEAKKACAIVLEPTSGEILAMAHAPTFDTNAFGDVPEELKRNWAVNDQYEPGSTFKMLVVAAALEAGLVTPETTFRLAPTIKVYDRVVNEAHRDQPAVREWTVTQILAQSSNVGAVTLGLEVGKDRLVDMISRFGFTRPLGIDFPGEAPGSMPEPGRWSGSTIANVPIGQGIATSPLQMAAAYAAIANDGVLVRPRLNRNLPAPERRVMSPEVAQQLRQMLSTTITEGTGQMAALTGYTVAGKTGTAQKVNENGGGYSREKYVASFVGMVPADRPELVILVAVDEPTKAYYGSTVAAPAFRLIADFAVKHLEIPPSEQPTEEER
jgi:cell division protein FtsI (penicillin-binding protein 3)